MLLPSQRGRGHHTRESGLCQAPSLLGSKLIVPWLPGLEGQPVPCCLPATCGLVRSCPGTLRASAWASSHTPYTPPSPHTTLRPHLSCSPSSLTPKRLFCLCPSKGPEGEPGVGASSRGPVQSPGTRILSCGCRGCSRVWGAVSTDKPCSSPACHPLLTSLHRPPQRPTHAHGCFLTVLSPHS